MQTKRVQSFVLIALFAAYGLAVLWHSDPPLLGDLSSWVYVSALIARHMQGLADTAHSIKHYPVPNSTFTFMLALLMLIAPWKVAAKLYLMLHLVLCCAASLHLHRALDSRRWAFIVVAPAAFLSLGFWYGWFAYTLALALLFFFIAALVRHREDGKVPTGCAVVLTLLFFCHVVPFVFACLLLVFFCLQHRRFRPLWMMTPALVLLIWYGLARMTNGNADAAGTATSSMSYMSLTFIAFKANTLFKTLGFVNPVDSTSPAMGSVTVAVLGRAVYGVLFAVNAVLVLASCALFAVNMRRGLNKSSSNQFFWRAALLGVAGYLLAPDAFLGISDPGARIVQCVLLPALFFSRETTAGEKYLWTAATSGATVVAAFSVFLFATVAWQPVAPAYAKHLPRPIEMLAKVPYASEVVYYNALSCSEFKLSVFQTSLIQDRPASTRGGANVDAASCKDVSGREGRNTPRLVRPEQPIH